MNKNTKLLCLVNTNYLTKYKLYELKSQDSYHYYVSDNRGEEFGYFKEKFIIVNSLLATILYQ